MLFEVHMSDYDNLEFNKQYKFSGPQISLFEFDNFYNLVKKHQSNKFVHPLTCGVDSNHENLVARITTSGIMVLVCPTCGYVQDTLPFTY